MLVHDTFLLKVQEGEKFQVPNASEAFKLMESVDLFINLNPGTEFMEPFVKHAIFVEYLCDLIKALQLPFISHLLIVNAHFLVLILQLSDALVHHLIFALKKLNISQH